MKKTNPELLPGERLDDLIIGGLKIIQHSRQFCFSIDAVLLAHFATLKPNASAVDLGAGAGVISLLLAARGCKHIDAVEINSYAADMAKRSAALNRLENGIFVHALDLRQIKEAFAAQSRDLVVSNPPYRPIGHGKVSDIEDIAAARHEIKANLNDVVRAAGYLLKHRGRFAMVHLPQRLPEIMEEMRAAGVEPKRLRLVQATSKKNPSIALIEGVAGARAGLIVEKPLIIYNDDGTYSQTISSYYQNDPA